MKKHGRFWKSRRRDDLFPMLGRGWKLGNMYDRASKRELKIRESEKKKEICDLEAEGAEF